MNTDLTEAEDNKSGRPKNSQIMRQSDCPNVITVLGPRNTPLRGSYLAHGGGYMAHVYSMLSLLFCLHTNGYY